MREEAIIFDDLAKLCSIAGYAHVIAFFCFRDNVISYSGELSPDDMLYLFSRERLVRTEISILIGLMFKAGIDLTLPKPELLQSMLQETEMLLQELHRSMTEPVSEQFKLFMTGASESNPFTHKNFLREAIFYNGESAYTFQYRDFSLKKYIKDDKWLQKYKGFTIGDAKAAIGSITAIQNEKVLNHLNSLEKVGLQNWSMLPAFIFSVTEIAEHSGISKTITNKILQAFISPKGEYNQNFNALNDFNITNAYPIIELGNDQYLLFQSYSLVEALYETPFYWMGLDKSYVNEAMVNRGNFTEEFSAQRLELVFGKHRVFSNIKIIDPKKHKKGKKEEIDVLVVYGDRAIILQAKSKRLTLEARKGNGNIIKDDFKKSVQDAYNQGLACAKLLNDENYKLIDANSNEISIHQRMSEIYIFCVVSDHYPALSFQARQFLQWEQTSTIRPPFVMDIFLLDIMTEMLCSPLYFLSYINRRTLYFEKVYASHESVILSYHLKSNLWLSNANDFLYLEDDIRIDLDLSMTVRRDDHPGKPTPDGILTQFKNTTISKLIREIEKLEDPTIIDFGFMLLTLNEKAILEINNGLETIANLVKKDGKSHDFTIGIKDGSTGLTIHCNDSPINIAALRLEGHCKMRKYTEKASNWFGICIDPKKLSINLGLKLDFPWFASKDMEHIVKNLQKSRKASSVDGIKSERRIGRNELCPCGSGIKFKRCCLLT